jgi:hypothetical protein
MSNVNMREGAVVSLLGRTCSARISAILTHGAAEFIATLNYLSSREVY